MKPQTFTHQSEFPVSAGQLFHWHERPGAFERLNPPWSPVTIVSHIGGIRDGAQVVLKVPVGPFHIRWKLKHQGYIAGERFQDVQVKGPFSSWEHTHLISGIEPERSRLTDTINYRMPLGVIGRAFKGVMVEDELKRLFKFRHNIVRNDLLVTNSYHANRPLRILVSGASGLIGEALVAFLSVAGHEVWKLVRRAPVKEKNEIFWDPANRVLDPNSVSDFNAVIHLGGENIAARRWTPEFKARLLTSRVESTALLAETLTKAKIPPRVFLCASAVGYYGNRGDDALSESASKGEGFLPDLADRWEIVARTVEKAHIRSVQLRTGIVLSPRGGALHKMLTPFLTGVGGVLGDGSQFMSWISLDDAVASIYFAMVTDQVRGAVNLVTPRPVTNLEFTKTLGAVLKRPTVLPVPKFAIRTLFGEMGEQLLLSSTRALPSVLQASGYNFLYPSLEDALRHQLGRAYTSRQ